MIIVWRTVLEKLVHASPKKKKTALLFSLFGKVSSNNKQWHSKNLVCPVLFNYLLKELSQKLHNSAERPAHTVNSGDDSGIIAGTEGVCLCWILLKSSIKPIRQTTPVFVPLVNSEAVIASQTNLQQAIKVSQTCLLAGVQNTSLFASRFETFLITNDERTSFLLWRKARREWEELVYILALTANYLTWLARCVWPGYTKQRCLERQYWRSHTAERAGRC